MSSAENRQALAWRMNARLLFGFTLADEYIPQ
jgi:hypothetical protein